MNRGFFFRISFIVQVLSHTHTHPCTHTDTDTTVYRRSDACQQQTISRNPDDVFIHIYIYMLSYMQLNIYNYTLQVFSTTLRWRHNDHAGVSNHQPRGCLLNRLFRHKSKKTSKLRVTGLCAGNSPGTGEFPAQMASHAENVSIWWRHHEICTCLITVNKQSPFPKHECWDKMAFRVVNPPHFN